MGYTVPVIAAKAQTLLQHMFSWCFSTLVFIVSVLIQDSMHLIFCHKISNEDNEVNRFWVNDNFQLVPSCKKYVYSEVW